MSVRAFHPDSVAHAKLVRGPTGRKQVSPGQSAAPPWEHRASPPQPCKGAITSEHVQCAALAGLDSQASYYPGRRCACPGLTCLRPFRPPFWMLDGATPNRCIVTFTITAICDDLPRFSSAHPRPLSQRERGERHLRGLEHLTPGLHGICGTFQINVSVFSRLPAARRLPSFEKARCPIVCTMPSQSKI